MTKNILWIFLIGLTPICITATYSNSQEPLVKYDVENHNRDLAQPDIQLLHTGEFQINCTGVEDRNSSGEFPDDLFTQDQLHDGAVILHFVAALYCFGMIGIVCGDYFLPSVDCICCDLKLSQDVAAATFMSFATCTPEFFTILIGTFITETDIGIGAVVGSGMFNILGVATCGGLAAAKGIKLDWWPLYRDSIIYTLTLCIFIYTIWDGIVSLTDSIILSVCYIIYFMIMACNQRLKRNVKGFVKKVQRRSTNQSASTNSTALPLSAISIAVTQDSASNIANNNIQQTTSFITPFSEKTDLEDDDLGNGTYKPYFIMYGEARRLSRKSTASEGSYNMRRLSKKSCYSDTNGSLRNKNNQTLWVDHFQEMYDDVFHVTMKNNLSDDNIKEKNILYYDNTLTPTEIVSESFTEVTHNVAESQEEESSIFQMPDGSVWESLVWILMFPATLIFYVTIPDCRTEKWRKFYPLTFLMCIVWIGITSYLGTWMISVLGDTIGIPDSIMGLTFLAAGGSMPEAISTVIMARQGVGGMGFSNSLGGNTMDICLCLAVPWLIKCALSGTVVVESEVIKYTCLSLFVGIFVLLVVATLTKFHMNKKMGVICFLFYLVFIVLSILVEIGVVISTPKLGCTHNR